MKLTIKYNGKTYDIDTDGFMHQSMNGKVINADFIDEIEDTPKLIKDMATLYVGSFL